MRSHLQGGFAFKSKRAMRIETGLPRKALEDAGICGLAVLEAVDDLFWGARQEAVEHDRVHVLRCHPSENGSGT